MKPLIKYPCSKRDLNLWLNTVRALGCPVIGITSIVQTRTEIIIIIIITVFVRTLLSKGTQVIPF
jgi:hypothetical protein